ncbi:MAG: ankyrin repeat domain-containing protein [Verrucomicrobiae bacterium]|nr:ankyrin repeat domain-containing protein [Verrucomicrobiae bacterium]
MKNVRFTCVNFGQCHEAGNPVADVTKPGASCRECGQPLVCLRNTGREPSPFWWIAAIFVVGGLVIFWAVRFKVTHLANGISSAGTKIIGSDLPSIDASKYFTGPNVRTLLNKAALGNRAGVHKVLVNHPELLREKGQGGVTPLHAALFSQDATAFEILLKEGFDPNTSARNGITPLMAAAMHPNSRFLAAALKETGTVPKQTDYKGRDALFLAVANRQSGNIKLLLQHGADPNCRDAMGNTALMAAFQGRRPNPDLIKLLLDAGADPALSDKTGLNARDFADSFNDPEILALLP